MNIEDAPVQSDFQRREPFRAGGVAFEPTECWFVVNHKQGLGGTMRDGTIGHLISEGFEFYRPMFLCHKRRREKGVRSTVIRPATEALFPGYVFVRRVRGGRTPITSIHGIEGGFLGAVTDEFIQRLKAEEVEGYIHFVRKHDPSRKNLGKGDTVETLDGFMSGLVECELPGQRLQLFSRFMNGAARVVVDVASVYRLERGKEAGGGGKGAANRFTEASAMAQASGVGAAGVAGSRPSKRSSKSA